MMAQVPEPFAGAIDSYPLVGDVGEAAELLLQCAERTNGPIALISGGETTVTLRGSGRGGRNQELALRIALGAERRLAPGWVFLSAGTDGRDGPTDAAGAITDSGTI